jgi:hypothetical protein
MRGSSAFSSVVIGIAILLAWMPMAAFVAVILTR